MLILVAPPQTQGNTLPPCIRAKQSNVHQARFFVEPLELDSTQPKCYYCIYLSAACNNSGACLWPASLMLMKVITYASCIFIHMQMQLVAGRPFHPAKFGENICLPVCYNYFWSKNQVACITVDSPDLIIIPLLLLHAKIKNLPIICAFSYRCCIYS